MKKEWLDVLREMRTAGYAVTVFTPDEMPNSESMDVEDMMYQNGWAQIEWDNAFVEKERTK